VSRRIVSRLGFTRLKVIGRSRRCCDKVQAQRSLFDSPKKQSERVMRWRSVPLKSLASCNATTLSSANTSRIVSPIPLSPAKESSQAGKSTQSLSSIGTLVMIVRVAADEGPSQTAVWRCLASHFYAWRFTNRRTIETTRLPTNYSLMP
jgi:hypothetical protein